MYGEMRYAAPVLAALLVLSLPAMTVVAAGPSTNTGPNDGALAQLSGEPISGGLVDAEGTTNRLTLNGETLRIGEIRSEYTQSGSDFGTVLVTRDDALRTDHALFTLESEFEEIADEERAEEINESVADEERAAAVDAFFEQIDELEQREQEAVAQHAAGDLSSEQLLSTLVRSYNDAAELSDALEEIDGYDTGEITDAQRALEVYQSDLRSDLDAIVRGEPDGQDQDVVVESMEHGVSVALLDGNTYVRETMRFDNRQPDDPDEIGDIDTADARFEEELYPWAFDNRVGGSQHNEAPTAQSYSAQTSTPQGSITAYLDGATGEIYHEVQSLSVEELPAEPLGTWDNDSLELSINETPVNGPLEVTVTDAETGEPVDATVTVDDYELGETDDDGTLWLVPPTGEFELTAESADETVTVTLGDD